MSDRSPNRDQAERWNSDSGKAWVEMQALLDQVLEPFERLVVETAFPGEGGQVLDIGCGAGATTLAMARRLGPGGHCLGLDISRPLIAAARARAATDGLANATFVEGDAQTAALDRGRYDAIQSRFGVMFFDDPVAAFANIRRGARPGAVLSFVAWRSPAENEFMTAAARAAAPLLPPAPPPDPNAPGQFAFADRSRVGAILQASGWTAVDLRRTDVACQIEERRLMDFATRLGPVGQALRQVDAPTGERVVAALRPVLGRFVTDGVARFNAACWLAMARN